MGYPTPGMGNPTDPSNNSRPISVAGQPPQTQQVAFLARGGDLSKPATTSQLLLVVLTPTRCP